MSNTEENLQLQRALSWQDVRDLPYLSTRRSSITEEGGYRYVNCSNRKYRKPPMHFSISILRIDGNTKQTTCRPGSIFEGIVQIKLSTPLAAEQLKLVFKAAEQVHGSSRKRGSRLFAIKTILWGAVTRNNNEQWPILETGEHQFPFMCEIPQVNYPPTFRHHLASCEFELLACIDRPGIRPFQTIPYSVRYEPFILSPNNINHIQENIELNNQMKVWVNLDDSYYNLLDSNRDILKVKLTTNQAIGTIEAYLKREVIVKHGSYHQSDSMVMSHAEQSTFGIVKDSNTGYYTYYIRLPIPSESSKNNNSTILKNFSVLGMTPTFYFSKYIKMEYKLYITIKIKYGLISTKKQLCCIPIYFGTIPIGENIPSNLLSYNDNQVINDTSFRTKPRFIKPLLLQEQLPAYEHDLSPPEYNSVT